MFEFTVSLADRIIAIRSLHEEIKRYCARYLCQGTPEFTVSICQADIDYERERSAMEDELEGNPTIHYSDSYLETLAVYRKIAEELMKTDTFLFHGSAIAVDGVAYLFTAKSGTGKSTHTALWRERFGERAVMINDDKPLIRVTPEGSWVYGTPWNGKHRLGTNTKAPLRAICVLERGEENEICQLAPAEALSMLLQQSHRPADPAGVMALLDLLDRMVSGVKLYKLACNMDPEAARVAFEGMNRP